MNSATAARPDRLSSTVAAIRQRLHGRIVGLDATIDLVLISIFAGGHCLLLGVPGLAKTLLVQSIADALDLTFRRIQFTPDLMPSDITGAEVIVEDKATGTRDFKFRQGPVFCNMLLADEINRTPPKTQSALLEAMEERTISTHGQKLALDDPFCVLATQNPIEQQGTYPLPAAQLDRFMFMLTLDYPSRDDEARIVRLTTAPPAPKGEGLVTKADLVDVRRALAAAPAPDAIVRFATTIARRTRPSEPDAHGDVKKYVAWGVGPRAAQWLVLGAKVRAALRGAAAPTIDDVRALVLPTFRHRLIVNFQAQADGQDSVSILKTILDAATTAS